MLPSILYFVSHQWVLVRVDDSRMPLVSFVVGFAPLAVVFFVRYLNSSLTFQRKTVIHLAALCALASYTSMHCLEGLTLYSGLPASLHRF